MVRIASGICFFLTLFTINEDKSIVVVDYDSEVIPSLIPDLYATISLLVPRVYEISLLRVGLVTVYSRNVPVLVHFFDPWTTSLLPSSVLFYKDLFLIKTNKVSKESRIR